MSLIQTLIVGFILLNPSFPTSFYLSGLLTLVNCSKVKWGAILQVVSTIAKVVALIIIIITGLVRLAQGRMSPVKHATVTLLCRI